MVFNDIDFDGIAQLALSPKYDRGIKIDKKNIASTPPEVLALLAMLYFRPDASRGGEVNAIKYFTKNGMSPELSSVLVKKAKSAMEKYLNSPQGRKRVAKRYRNYMIWGACILAFGLLITIVTYSLSGPGGTFIIGYGGIIFGPVYLIIGIRGLQKYRNRE